MNDTKKRLSPEDQNDMHDLFEALTDFIGEKDVDMNVIMHALCRTIAYGGVQMYRYDEMTKRQFVAMVVESTSAHYDDLFEALKHTKAEDDDE